MTSLGVKIGEAETKVDEKGGRWGGLAGKVVLLQRNAAEKSHTGPQFNLSAWPERFFNSLGLTCAINIQPAGLCTQPTATSLAADHLLGN